MPIIRRAADFWRAELTNLPIVSFRVIAVTGLDYITCVMVFIMCIFKATPDAISIAALTIWAGLLAGLHGFNANSYKASVQSTTTTPTGVQMSTEQIAAVSNAVTHEHEVH